MPSQNELQNRIRTMVAEDKISDVFEVLVANIGTSEEDLNTVFALMGRNSNLQRKITRGTISTDEANLETNRIRDAILKLVGNFKDQDLQSFSAELSNVENEFWKTGAIVYANIRGYSKMSSLPKYSESTSNNEAQIMSSERKDANAFLDEAWGFIKRSKETVRLKFGAGEFAVLFSNSKEAGSTSFH